jgi:transcriptional regulator with XRE-family HTH domain
MTTAPDNMNTIPWNTALQKELGLPEQPSFAEILWAWRKCEDLTQVEVAKSLGMSKQQLSAYERGREIPSLKTGLAIIQQLNMPIATSLQALLQDQAQQAGVPQNLKIQINTQAV